MTALLCATPRLGLADRQPPGVLGSEQIADLQQPESDRPPAPASPANRMADSEEAYRVSVGEDEATSRSLTMPSPSGS
jgi:hypothetical protein